MKTMIKKTNNHFTKAVLLLLIATITVAQAAQPEKYNGILVDPPKTLKSNPLVNQHGENVSFPASNGKWQLVFFGFTSCGMVCPMGMRKMKMIKNGIGSLASKVDFNFVSIDPERDNPERIKNFISDYDDSFHGLTGKQKQISIVQKEFQILTRKFQGTSALDYTMQHSSYLYLLNGKGQIHMIFPGDATHKNVADDLKKIIR